VKRLKVGTTYLQRIYTSLKVGKGLGVGIHSSKDTVKVCREMVNLDTEIMAIFYLDSLGHVTCYSLIEPGKLDEFEVSSREIAKNTILSNSRGVILVHNHPSGDSDPSEKDIQTYKKVRDVLKMIDGITVIDYIIIARDGYSAVVGDEEITFAKHTESIG